MGDEDYQQEKNSRNKPESSKSKSSSSPAGRQLKEWVSCYLETSKSYAQMLEADFETIAKYFPQEKVDTLDLPANKEISQMLRLDLVQKIHRTIGKHIEGLQQFDSTMFKLFSDRYPTYDFDGKLFGPVAPVADYLQEAGQGSLAASAGAKNNTFSDKPLQPDLSRMSEISDLYCRDQVADSRSSSSSEEDELSMGEDADTEDEKQAKISVLQLKTDLPKKTRKAPTAAAAPLVQFMISSLMMPKKEGELPAVAPTAPLPDYDKLFAKLRIPQKKTKVQKLSSKGKKKAPNSAGQANRKRNMWLDSFVDAE